MGTAKAAAAIAATKQASKTKKTVSKETKATTTVTTTSPFDPKVSLPLVTKAVQALLDHHTRTTAESSKTTLLEQHVSIQVQLGLYVPPHRAQVKPVRLPVPHSIHASDNEECDICLIVKDDATKTAIQEMQQAVISSTTTSSQPPMVKIAKILTLPSLRSKYAQFQQRRDLLHRFHVFLADDRILPMLTQALGKEFLVHKKQPIPIRTTRASSLFHNIHRVLHQSTFCAWNRGTCITISSVGTSDMSPSELVDNVMAVVNYARMKLPVTKEGKNLRSISLKTPTSMALPIYNANPIEQMKEYNNMSAATAEEEEASNDKDKKETTQKRKRDGNTLAAKSPLVKALQKQKQEQQETTKEVDDDTHQPPKKQSKKDAKSQNTTKKEKKPVEDSKDDDEPKERQVSSKQQKTKKGKTDKDATHQDKKETKEKQQEKKNDPAEDKKGKKSPKDDTAAKSQDKPEPPMEKAGKRSQKDDAAAKSQDKVKKSKKEEATPTSKKPQDKATPTSTETKSDQAFLASTHYKGSKKGYVFKNGSHGVGYYVDQKPVVDKMALEAILRMVSASKKKNNPKSHQDRSRSRSKSQGHKRR